MRSVVLRGSGMGSCLGRALVVAWDDGSVEHDVKTGQVRHEEFL